MARKASESTATPSLIDRLLDDTAGQTGLAGLVMDSFGKPLAGALIKIDNESHTQPMQTISEPNGRYSFPRVPPGAYRLSAEAPGFRTFVDTDVRIEVRQLHVLNANLSEGDPAETIEVAGRARLAVASPTSRADSVRRAVESLRRDLEWLLNTRKIAVEPDPGLKELNQSVYVFGLPDLSGFSLSAPKDRAKLLRVLQTAIKIFEPRLANVRVIPVEAPDTGRQSMNFRIEGLMRLDPTPEPVSFDTVLKLASGEYEVKGEADAG
jgi:type VI secretion system protein ImpF